MSARGGDALALLLRAGLAPEETAIAAWQAVESRLDLEDISGDEYDALCLAGSRLGELGVTADQSERIAGVVRHAWTSRQLALGSTANRDPQSGPPLLLGRIATVVYLPAGRQLPVGPTIPDVRWDGPVRTVTADGHDFQVPPPSAQLVDSSIQRRVVDVACLLVTGVPAPDVLVEADRRRRRAAVRSAIDLVTELLGSTADATKWPVIPCNRAALTIERLRRTAAR